MNKQAQGRLGIGLVVLQLFAYYGNRDRPFGLNPVPFSDGFSAFIPSLGGFLGYNLIGIIGAILIYRGFSSGPAKGTPAIPDTPATSEQPPAGVLGASEVDEDIPWESNVEQTDDPGGEWEELNDWPKDTDPSPVPPKS